MITMTVDDDGETTTIDTIVFNVPDIDLDSIMENINIQMDITKDEMKEIRMEILTNIDEAHDAMVFKMDKQSEDIEKALKDLQKELDQLEMDDEVQQRIQDAMEILEKMGTTSFHHMESFFSEEDHPVFVGEDGKIEVLVKSDGGTETTEVIWIDDEGNVSKETGKELMVWVDSDENKKVIVKKNGTITEEKEFVIHADDGGDGEIIMMDFEGKNMMMLHSAKEKDLDQAILAGLPINKDQMIEELNINMDIKGEANPIVKLKTESAEKMTVTTYDEGFNKVKKLKVKLNNGENVFELDRELLKKSNAAYILLEQEGKTDLMMLKF
jgi:hypothetical protein